VQSMCYPREGGEGDIGTDTFGQRSNPTSTRIVATWKGDTLKRPRLPQPLKLLSGKADIRIRTATPYHRFH
jgi:hypothetical protein